MKSTKRRREIIVFLCNIRSSQNAGATMRTADAIGASKVIFGGLTPAPVDRFGRANKAFTKASLGAEKSVVWEQVKNCAAALRGLKKEGVFIIAVEQSRKSVDYKKIAPPRGPVSVIFGNEVSGLPKTILSLADIVAEIPMRGSKESLNVSVSAGIALYRWFDL